MVEIPKADLIRIFDLVDVQSSQIDEMAARERLREGAGEVASKCELPLGPILGALVAGVLVGVLIE